VVVNISKTESAGGGGPKGSRLIQIWAMDLHGVGGVEDRKMRLDWKGGGTRFKKGWT